MAKNPHNDAGAIAGAYYENNLAFYGFTYSGGVFTTVDATAARGTELRRIKNNGNVIGVVLDGLGEYHGIIGR